jgi:hypothetical protein
VRTPVPFPSVDECVALLPPPPSFAYQASVTPAPVVERQLFLHDGTTITVRENASGPSVVSQRAA